CHVFFSANSMWRQGGTFRCDGRRQTPGTVPNDIPFICLCPEGAPKGQRQMNNNSLAITLGGATGHPPMKGMREERRRAGWRSLVGSVAFRSCLVEVVPRVSEGAML